MITLKDQEGTGAERPYERFLRYGERSLTNAELLAVMVRTGTRSVSALDTARRILEIRSAGNRRLDVLRDLSLEDLLQIPGIGEVKAVRILCLAEIARRMAEETRRDALVFDNSESVADYYMERMCHMHEEHVMLVMLDNRLGAIGEEIMSIGSVNAALMSPRDVFRRALRRGAVYVVILHNHPSGDPSPSPEDREITRRIRLVGEELDVRLLDHIIIGDHRYTSFRMEGMLG